MVDTNHDDKITLAELTSFAASRDIVVADNHLAEYFRAMDRNKKVTWQRQLIACEFYAELEDSSRHLKPEPVFKGSACTDRGYSISMKMFSNHKESLV